MVKQGMLSLSCALVGACAAESAGPRPFVVAAEAPLASLPDSRRFPELEAAMGRAGPGITRTLGYSGYEVSAVLPRASQWRYVRDPRLRVVVRRESPVGLALRARAPLDRCVYLEPTVIQDRLGARDWGPLRLVDGDAPARRLDCGLVTTPLASR